MTTVKESKVEQLQDQLAALQVRIEEEARLREEALATIQSLMAEFALTTEDVVVKRKRGPNKKKAVAIEAKYQDPKTGATWSGRGREPFWIKGKKRDRFLIAE
jgi:DNA-binding protein H-NS